MKKIYLLIGLFALLSGCSTVSQYDQGCRDGIDGIRINGSELATEEYRHNYCDGLEAKKNLERQEQERETMHRR